MAETDIRKVHCNRCNTTTNQLVLHAEKTEYWETIHEYADIGGGGTYSILKCRGCETISFLSETWFSENADPETGTYDIDVHQYPPRPKIGRRRPDWLGNFIFTPAVPNDITIFLDEIYR